MNLEKRNPTEEEYLAYKTIELECKFRDKVDIAKKLLKNIT